MDPSSIVVLVGITTLLIERICKWAMKIKNSTCCCCGVEMKEERSHSE